LGVSLAGRGSQLQEFLFHTHLDEYGHRGGEVKSPLLLQENLPVLGFRGQFITQTRDKYERLLVGILIVLAITVYSYAMTHFSVAGAAQAIKDGERPSVAVRYSFASGSADQVTKTGLEVIEATQDVVFFYDVKDQRTLAIPKSQIVSIEN
jgi:hypothetical protein